MKYKLKKLALAMGAVASITAPVSAVVACGNKKTAAPAHGPKKGSGQGTAQQQKQNSDDPFAFKAGNGTGNIAMDKPIWEVWNDAGSFEGSEDKTEIVKADMSALHYVINDESVNTELNAMENQGRVQGAEATKIANAAKEIIRYYTDANFANTRVEFEVVNKVNNVFKLKNGTQPYTNEKRKVDVYGYEVQESEEGLNKLHIIGSSAVAMAHAFYLYVKQNEYGLIGWADAQGGTWNKENHSINDFERNGNSLVIPGTVKGKAAGRGEQLALAERVVARSPYEKHWFNNNVTSAYTMAYWDKSQWESHLNWLAVHGYDLILDPVATEAIQFKVWKRLLYKDKTEEEAYEGLRKFFTGPTFSSWQRKGNMTNYDIPREYKIFKAWNDKQIELEKFIKSKASERGIETSVQGFSGFVPLDSVNKDIDFGNGHVVRYASDDLYTTEWSIGSPSDISHSSENAFGETNSYYGHMLDPSIVAKNSTTDNPMTAYQLIGNEIVKEYENTILDGEKQKYFNEDPFDEMHPMSTHADGSEYTHDLFNTNGLTGKQAFLADLGYGLSKATLGVNDGTKRMVTNIAWQYTYMRADWDRRSFNSMIVGHDRANPNFTPDNYLIVSLGEDWDRAGDYGTDDGTRVGQSEVINPGDSGFDVKRDGYDFAFYGGFQDYGVADLEDGASAVDKADATRGMHFDYNDLGTGGGSFAYTPLVCLGAGNLPGGELGYHANGLADMFYNIDQYPGGAANKDGRRPLLDNFMAYGPGMEGFEQNEIIYEVMSDMGWRQEPLNVPNENSPIPGDGGYANEGQTHDIFKAYLANYASNRYNFNDKAMADFLYDTTKGGFYDMSTGNPRHAWEYTFFKYSNPWKSTRGSQTGKMLEDYDKFRKVINRHKNDEHKSQLLMDDLALYTMDYLGTKFDETLKIMKSFIDSNFSDIQKEGSQAKAQFDDYVRLSKWYYHVMDKLMANTTLWRMERWVDFAREWGDDDQSKAWFESDAKRILTVWGPDTVSDYAARAWSGLIRYQEAARMHGLELFSQGQDLMSIPHGQYLWSEDNFEIPAMPDAFWVKGFENPYEKALQLLTIAPSINFRGIITDGIATVIKQEVSFTCSGDSSHFQNTGATNGGLSAPVTMAEMNQMKGKEVKIELVTSGKVHINNIYFNDISGKNTKLMTVNQDVEHGTALTVTFPANIPFSGGNNGDLSIVVDGVAANGAPMPTRVAVKLTPNIVLNQVGVNTQTTDFGTLTYDSGSHQVFVSVEDIARNAIATASNPFDRFIHEVLKKATGSEEDIFDANGQLKGHVFMRGHTITGWEENWTEVQWMTPQQLAIASDAVKRRELEAQAQSLEIDVEEDMTIEAIRTAISSKTTAIIAEAKTWEIANADSDSILSVLNKLGTIKRETLAEAKRLKVQVTEDMTPQQIKTAIANANAQALAARRQILVDQATALGVAVEDGWSLMQIKNAIDQAELAKANAPLTRESLTSMDLTDLLNKAMELGITDIPGIPMLDFAEESDRTAIVNAILAKDTITKESLTNMDLTDLLNKAMELGITDIPGIPMLDFAEESDRPAIVNAVFAKLNADDASSDIAIGSNFISNINSMVFNAPNIYNLFSNDEETEETEGTDEESGEGEVASAEGIKVQDNISVAQYNLPVDESHTSFSNFQLLRAGDTFQIKVSLDGYETLIIEVHITE